MNTIRRSMLLSLGLILMACLLAAAAAGVHPEKKCYNSSGDEIPCPSNYYQTQFAARATAREAGPTAPRIAAASATASPTVTPTATATATETPAPTFTQSQETVPPATSASQAAPPSASGPQPGAPRPSALMVLIPILMLGGAAVLFVVLLFLLFRWLTGRRNTPGPPS